MPDPKETPTLTDLERIASPHRIRKQACDSFDEICKLMNQANINMAKLAKEIQAAKKAHQVLQQQLKAVVKQIKQL